MFRVGLAAIMLIALIFIMADSRANFAYSTISTRQSASATIVAEAAADQLFNAFKNEMQANQPLLTPAFQAIPMCNTPGCGSMYGDDATYACQQSTSSASGATITTMNLNSRVSEQLVSCTITARVWVGGAVRSQRMATQSFRIFNQVPFVQRVGVLDYSGSAVAQTQGDAGGCDSTRPTSCDPNVTAPVGDTIVRTQNTCVTDPTECSYGQAPPGDSYSNPSWRTDTASSNGAPH